MDGVHDLFDGGGTGTAVPPRTLITVPKPPDERNGSNLVGLDNQGATCYLNSLLQAMYFTPELRFGLYKLDPQMVLGSDAIDEDEEKKEDATKGVAEADEGMVASMTTMGVDVAQARVALVAVKSAGVEQAMEYLFSHESDVQFVEAVKQMQAQMQAQAQAQKKPKQRKTRTIPLELQRLFAQMQLLNKKSLSTQGEDTTPRDQFTSVC